MALCIVRFRSVVPSQTVQVRWKTRFNNRLSPTLLVMIATCIASTSTPVVKLCIHYSGCVVMQEGHSRSVYTIAFQNDGALMASG